MILHHLIVPKNSSLNPVPEFVVMYPKGSITMNYRNRVFFCLKEILAHHFFKPTVINAAANWQIKGNEQTFLAHNEPAYPASPPENCALHLNKKPDDFSTTSIHENFSSHHQK